MYFSKGLARGTCGQKIQGDIDIWEVGDPEGFGRYANQNAFANAYEVCE